MEERCFCEGYLASLGPVSKTAAPQRAKRSGSARCQDSQGCPYRYSCLISQLIVGFYSQTFDLSHDHPFILLGSVQDIPELSRNGDQKLC